MEHSTCFHCTHVFDVNNLKKECRRDIKKLHGDVDIIQILANSYGLNDTETVNLFRVFDDIDDLYVCSKCFSNIKSIATSSKKCQQQKESLIRTGSSQFKNTCEDFSSSIHVSDRIDNVDVKDADHDLQPWPFSRKKRRRHHLTPVKSGFTPRGKRQVHTTPKANRRRLNFSDGTPKPTQTPKSPGPRVKVKIGFKGQTRLTKLKGHDKLACRAIVMKQYKTALNHLLNIQDVKKNISGMLKKTICSEINKLCRLKTCVLRLDNILNFTWRAAFRQLQTICPITMEVLQCISGGKAIQMPRVVSSFAILLFTRNQSLSTLQAINSIFMYRGHVRTRVYSTFNRAGLCKSYKSTLTSVDKICENFDSPVKKWSQNIVTKRKELNPLKKSNSTVADDHAYAASYETEDITVHEQSISEDCMIVTPMKTPTTSSDHDDFIYNTVPETLTWFKVPETPTIFADDHAYAASYETEDITVHEQSISEDLIVTPMKTPTTSSMSHYNNHDDFIYNTVPETPTCLKVPETPKENASTISKDSLLTTHVPVTSPVIDIDSPFTTITKSTHCQQDLPSGFQIIMDNLNLQQKARHKTSENINKMHNLTHSIAVQDRVSNEQLDDIHPQADILSIPEEAFIPSPEDYERLNDNFKHLIKRTLVEYMPAFENYKDSISFNIEHEFSKESAKKSNVIPLGILEKNENVTEEMIDIVKNLQQYVPRDDGKMLPLLLGGDALSVERGVSAQRARSDGVTQEDRLDGFVWKSEDWHGHVTSLQDAFNLHYKGTSAGEIGTLFQLRNFFDRRGVKSEIKDAVNDSREFIRFITKGLIVVAALHILKLKSITDTFPIPENKEQHIGNVASKIVDLIKTEPVSFENCEPLTATNEAQNEKNCGRVKCGYPGCTKSFAVDGKCRIKHREVCPYKELNILEEPEVIVNIPADCIDAPLKSKDEIDSKRNYTCSLLRDGLMDWNREDAAKENDGPRLIRMWRFDMLRYSINNHTKYRLLAFRLQAQLMALLPPKMANQLLHNRCVNIHGGVGGNVPGDLALEFMNMRAKDALNSLHGNLSTASITCCGRSLQGCNDIIDAYTQGLEQYFGKPSNSKPSLKGDIQKFVKHIEPQSLFDIIPGRCHRSFKDFCFNPLEKLNRSKLKIWIREKKEEYSKAQRTRSYLV